MFLGKSASRSPLGREAQMTLHPSFAELRQKIPTQCQYVNGKVLVSGRPDSVVTKNERGIDLLTPSSATDILKGIPADHLPLWRNRGRKSAKNEAVDRTLLRRDESGIREALKSNSQGIPAACPILPFTHRYSESSESCVVACRECGHARDRLRS